MPSGLPQLAATSHTPTALQYSPHDPSHYAPQNVQYSGYVDTTAASRPLPEVISYSPVHGQAGTELTIRLRSGHDLDSPSMTPVIMFGQKRCPGVLSRTTSQPSTSFDYSLTTEAPPLTPTSTPSPQFPLVLTFEDSSVNGQASSTEFGKFTYLDDASFQQPIHSTPQTGTMRKRKLDAEASPRRSPTKKPSMHNLSAAAGAYRQPAPSSPVQLRNAGEPYSHTRRFSGPDFQQQTLQQPPHKLRAARSMYFPSAQPTPSLHAPPTPTWSQMGDPQQQGRLYGMNKTSIVPLPSPNPSLVRTSTLQQSPTMPSAAIAQPQFNPYAMMYPSKAALKIEGDLNSMTYKWTAEEWEAGRRLVQFRRSQQGSTISASFEAVTLEDRIPNSICVSCIWWAEKEECFVTSVDTISLLESLVSVRFTVEEKNRIRRNLEGFRPLTVSKTKQDSDDFFKLIMGFPNPKPRNIEKDVKVFPWRILATALKKIIGKYVSHSPPSLSFSPASTHPVHELTTHTVRKLRVHRRRAAWPRAARAPAAALTCIPALDILRFRSVTWPGVCIQHGQCLPHEPHGNNGTGHPRPHAAHHGRPPAIRSADDAGESIHHMARLAAPLLRPPHIRARRAVGAQRCLCATFAANRLADSEHAHLPPATASLFRPSSASSRAVAALDSSLRPAGELRRSESADFQCMMTTPPAMKRLSLDTPFIHWLSPHPALWSHNAVRPLCRLVMHACNAYLHDVQIHAPCATSDCGPWEGWWQ